MNKLIHDSIKQIKELFVNFDYEQIGGNYLKKSNIKDDMYRYSKNIKHKKKHKKISSLESSQLNILGTLNGFLMMNRNAFNYNQINQIQQPIINAINNFDLIPPNENETISSIPLVPTVISMGIRPSILIPQYVQQQPIQRPPIQQQQQPPIQ